ncbi:MAG TPA: TRAP transporter large permease subunit [Bacteroidota bacterium]|nr:TRAP transporter large permease subunit [Bacteroidota bacterium]
MTGTVLTGILLLALAFLGSPLFAVIGAAALAAFHFAGIDSSAIIVELFRIANAPTLLAIPLFTFAGYMLAESRTPSRLIGLSQALLGWIPGGVAVVTLVSCAVFTAFTGASGVTIIALGGLLYPILTEQRYSERFSLGLLTTSGSLGLLFPPSLPLILYGMVASNTRMIGGGVPDVSIDKLFVAGILPGILLVVLLSAYSIRKNAGSGTIPFSFAAALRALRRSAWEVPLPFIILFGIYGGDFTATEAASVTVVYVLIVEVFVYGDLTLRKDIPRIMGESLLLVGAILIILGCAMGLTNYLIDEQIPMKLFEFVRSFVTSKAAFLVLLNLFLIVVGMMMDIFSAIIVVVPLIIPIATAYGIHPVHLGIIFLTNLEIGYLTPPVGLNLFISSYRFDKSIPEVLRSVVPFFVLLLLALVLVTYIPELSTFLVDRLGVR